MNKIILTTVAVASCGLTFARPAPRAAIQERFDREEDVIGIVHWGPNTYSDVGWGYGDEKPETVNPSGFDADQIVGACRDGGLCGLIVVAKHHDGFCLWPTKTTPHNISASPFRGGKGDYVREMEQACRRAGIRFGVYVSPWDRNNPHYGTPEYVELYHRQIKELLSGDYGEVFEMWFDNANGGDGYYGGKRERRTIPRDYYRFDEIFAFVRKLQPHVAIFNEADHADFRYGGNERGIVDPDSRATATHFDREKWAEYKSWANVGVKDGPFFHPIEADFPLRPEWFYHAKEDGRTKCAAYLMKIYLRTVGNGATMNVGISPNRTGVLVDDDVRALRGFRTIREAFFRSPVTKDGEPFNMIVMRENLSKGEQVDGWEFVADGKALLSGKTIGNKRIRVFETPIAPKVCSVRITADGGEFQGVTLARYYVDPDLVKIVLASDNDSGETDTAKWMSGVEKEKRPNR